MRRQIKREQSPWPRLALPAVGFLAVAGVLFLIAFQLAQEGPLDLLPEQPTPPAETATNHPFALSRIHERLPPEALVRVEGYIEYFRTSRRRGFQDSLARSTRYLAGYRRIFRQAGVPEELAFLPLIESGFVETAVSPAKAVGVWQFIAETGRRYDLSANHWFDKRRDPIISGYAAARYLRHLYKVFGDWDLALAAYNSGAGTVRWAVKANRKAGRPTDFWALELPEETRNYVPAFLAAMLIAQNPPAFGFHDIRFMPKVVFEQIKVSPGFSLAFLAEKLGIEAETLFNLNPALLRGQIPPGTPQYSLRIPLGIRRQVPLRLTGIRPLTRDWVLHRVTSEDTLQELASRYRALPARIIKANGLQGLRELTKGSILIIPL